MRIRLIQPPQSDPSQPYSALAVLLASWRTAGLEVGVEDLNLGFFNYICRPEFLKEARYDARRKLAKRQFQDELELTLLERAVTTEGWLESLTPKAINILKEPDHFYDPAKYAWAFRMIKRALDVVSASAYPGKVTLQSFETGHSHLSPEGILAATADNRSNLFGRYCDEVVMPALVSNPPDVIGVSVTFQTQIIPAWTLAARVKRAAPALKVVFGGAMITRISDGLRRSPQLFRDLDACVLFEGESAFPSLMEEWAAGRSGRAAPNVMLPARDEVVVSSRVHQEDMDALPPPDHDGIQLAEYWWPEPALLLNTSRGCYYGRCAFCTISPATWGPARGSQAFRVRSVDRVVEDIRYVQKRTGARVFNLSNDALPPRILADLSESLAGSALGVTWDTEIRLDRGLNGEVLGKMHQGGCRHLRFGFETGSPRILNLMNKGTDLEVTRRILHDCRESHITVSLLCQIGFPGETIEEAWETCRFLHDHTKEVAFVSLTPFVLETGSRLWQEPERFGVALVANPESESLSWMHRYSCSQGAGVDESARLYTNIETHLDRSYPDRDLFFKGGLGHAHTSLYVARYPSETLMAWNRVPLRGCGDLTSDDQLRTANNLALHMEGDSRRSRWSRFIISSGEVPELFAKIDGTTLILLVAAVDSARVKTLAQLICRLSADTYNQEEAQELVRRFYDAGVLLKVPDDRRASPRPIGMDRVRQYDESVKDLSLPCLSRPEAESQSHPRPKCPIGGH